MSFDCRAWPGQQDQAKHANGSCGAIMAVASMITLASQ